MAEGATAKQFAKSFSAYSCVLTALGFEVDEGSVLESVAQRSAMRANLKRILDAHRAGTLNGDTLDAMPVRCMEALRADLMAKVAPMAESLTGLESAPANIATQINSLGEIERDSLADIVELDGQRRMVKTRLMSVEEFQRLLSDFAGEQTVARQKLVAHLRDELLRRGIDMSCETIEERFRSNPAVRTMPACVRHVFRSLGDEFRTGLVPMAQLVGGNDVDQWLEEAQAKLQLRSQSAMHKAIAEATGLTYDSIHKALSGRRKAKRIQVEVVHCLHGWLRDVEAGREPAIADEHRGVPLAKMHALMPRLLPAFRKKEAVYTALAEKTDLRKGSIRRYFQTDGQLKYAPLTVYRAASALVEEFAEIVEVRLAQQASQPAAPTRRRARRQTIAPTPRQVRKQAVEIANQAEVALERWKQNEKSEKKEELEVQFKEARLALIMKLGQKRRRQPVAV